MTILQVYNYKIIKKDRDFNKNELKKVIFKQIKY